MKKLSFLSIPVLIFTLLFCTTAFAQKNVAVLEIDRRASVANEISRDEAMEITNVIRAEAVNTLPRARYSVMTSETIMSMGGAVAADCADENCVITIGRRIDADYIVRGTLSKFQTRYTLNIEMFETDYGNLVATAVPIRSENLNEILEKSASACVDMYKKYLGDQEQAASQASAPPQTVAPVPVAPPPQSNPAAPRPSVAVSQSDPSAHRSSAFKRTIQISTGALAVGGIVGGLVLNGIAESEHENYRSASEPQDAQDARKNTESLANTRNLLYIFGGICAAGFTVTLFF